jgi:hypothetical protein
LDLATPVGALGSFSPAEGALVAGTGAGSSNWLSSSSCEGVLKGGAPPRKCSQRPLGSLRMAGAGWWWAAGPLRGLRPAAAGPADARRPHALALLPRLLSPPHCSCPAAAELTARENPHVPGAAANTPPPTCSSSASSFSRASSSMSANMPTGCAGGGGWGGRGGQ